MMPWYTSCCMEIVFATKQKIEPLLIFATEPIKSGCIELGELSDQGATTIKIHNLI